MDKHTVALGTIMTPFEHPVVLMQKGLKLHLVWSEKNVRGKMANCRSARHTYVKYGATDVVVGTLFSYKDDKEVWYVRNKTVRISIQNLVKEGVLKVEGKIFQLSNTQEEPESVDLYSVRGPVLCGC